MGDFQETQQSLSQFLVPGALSAQAANTFSLNTLAMEKTLGIDRGVKD
jgi:hypothetical protein